MNRVYLGGNRSIAGENERRRGRGTETLVPRKKKKLCGLVAGDELFDFGLTFEDTEREIDERKEETIRL